MTIDSNAPTRAPHGFCRRRTDDRPDLRILAQAEQHWRSLFGTKQLPQRSDIDAGAMPDALPYTMILERVAPGMARVRLAGRALSQLLGVDPRGMPLCVLVTADSRATLTRHLETVFAGPALVEIPLQIGRGWGRRPVPGRVLLLPLADETGDVTRALAVVTTQGQMPSGGTHRFEIQPEGAFRCTFLPKAETRLRKSPEPAIERRRFRAQRTSPQSALPLVPRPVARLRVIEGGGVATKPVVPDGRPALHLIVSEER